MERGSQRFLDAVQRRLSASEGDDDVSARNHIALYKLNITTRVINNILFFFNKKWLSSTEFILLTNWCFIFDLIQRMKLAS